MLRLLGSNVEVVIETKKLLPYFSIALETAKTSPCTRRKYGVVIASLSNDVFYTAAANYGVSKCCQGNACARDRLGIRHGQRVEVGGEIHAEQSALIQWKGYDDGNSYVCVIVGIQNGKELYGRSCYPCHVCALMLKYAGFRHIYIKDDYVRGEIVITSINQVIDYRELEWEDGE